MVRDTSLQAFLDFEYSGKLAESQRLVLNFIKKNPYVTDKEISVGLNIPINQVTARRNELAKKRLIYDFGKRPCQITKKLAYMWYAAMNQTTQAQDYKAIN